MVRNVKTGNGRRSKAVLWIAVTAVLLSACGGKDRSAGQSMARVNGQDITVHQLNAELERVPAGQAVSKKEILDAVISRQLLVDQAAKEKMDRDPKIMQAIERSKEQILAQAYLQTRLKKIERPAEAEVEKFYEQNPTMFAKRKIFDTKELTIATKDFNDEVAQKMSSARSLDEVASWLDDRQIRYVPTQAVRNSAEMPEQLVKMLSEIPTGRLFTVKQGDQSQLALFQDVKDSPLTLAIARPKIEQYLMMKKSQEISEAEIARLRTAAKIEYLNDADKLDNKQAVATTTPVVPAQESEVGRGLAGLKK